MLLEEAITRPPSPRREKEADIAQTLLGEA